MRAGDWLLFTLIFPHLFSFASSCLEWCRSRRKRTYRDPSRLAGETSSRSPGHADHVGGGVNDGDKGPLCVVLEDSSLNEKGEIIENKHVFETIKHGVQLNAGCRSSVLPQSGLNFRTSRSGSRMYSPSKRRPVPVLTRIVSVLRDYLCRWIDVSTAHLKVQEHTRDQQVDRVTFRERRRP